MFFSRNLYNGGFAQMCDVLFAAMILETTYKVTYKEMTLAKKKNNHILRKLMMLKIIQIMKRVR